MGVLSRLHVGSHVHLIICVHIKYQKYCVKMTIWKPSASSTFWYSESKNIRKLLIKLLIWTFFFRYFFTLFACFHDHMGLCSSQAVRTHLDRLLVAQMITLADYLNSYYSFSPLTAAWAESIDLTGQCCLFPLNFQLHSQSCFLICCNVVDSISGAFLELPSAAVTLDIQARV